MNLKTTILSSVLTLLAELTTLAGPCQVHVVLFIPADVRPPAAALYQPRIDQIVAYTETFFLRELKRHGHQNLVSPFRRNTNGKVEVMVIRGKERTADYKPVPLRVELMDTLRAQKKITEDRQIWWIMVYPGDPPARFAAFLGGYGPEIGGWSVCNLDTTPGRIDPAAPLGADFLEKIALKGMIHELGHAFQLPHMGPLKKDGPGNTLMGPTHANFRRVVPSAPDRVYLCEAEAAIFASHPAFRGLPDTRAALPKPEVQNLKFAANGRNNMITVTGRVRCAPLPVYALVADESEERPGEYWTKTYAAKVAADGTFEVIISEPSPSNGTFKTWFAFGSGAQTGDGESRGRDSGIPQPYTYASRRWTFK